jgi:hypothetical protein
MVRMSMPITASSGTELTFSPPRMVPTFKVGPPRSGSGATSKRNPASDRTAWAALTTAFTPLSGIDPCAVTPRVRACSQRAPLWPSTGTLPVGSPTIIAPALPSAPSVRARCAAPSQPVSSPATSTSVSPALRICEPASCSAAATMAATPLFMSLDPRP